MRIHILVCKNCGALSTIPKPLPVDYDKSIGEVVSRCGIVYEKDWGDEPCHGDVVIVAYIAEQFDLGK